MTATVPVLITCYNRPMYLWACLDSLFRHTAHSHQFTLLDMASDDPLVATVIDGFARRGMFADVIRAQRNHVDELWNVLWPMVKTSPGVFGYVEGDVVVEEQRPCWLSTFVDLMERRPSLAMVGAAIDGRDFVPWDRALDLAPKLDEGQLAGLVKLHSPERRQTPYGPTSPELDRPHNPPGRLLLLRSAALMAVGAGTDGELDRKLREAGYETGIATHVRHRHLSLLNIFDYPVYDTSSRDAFMKSLDVSSGRRA